MSIEFRITRGARAGERERFDKSIVSIGRHPMNDLRFDANKDIDVSGRHAELRSLGNRHVIHDLGSTNGTFVNGERVAAEREVKDGDLLTFGPEGPQATFHVVSAASKGPDAPPATRAATPSEPLVATRSHTASAEAAAFIDAATKGGAGSKGGAAKPKPKVATEVRIAHAVRQQTGRLRQMVIALGALVVVGGGGVGYVMVRSARESQKQVAALLAMNDSLARSLEQRLAQTGLADAALAAARAETDRLNRALQAQQASGGDVKALSAQMRDAQSRTASIAGTDYPAIAASNKPATTFIAVEMPDGTTSSGSGFNILPSGLVVTNRHVVQAPDGRRARRVGVIFEGQKGEWLEARIEAVSDEDELAVLRLVRPGTYPIVNGIARDGQGVQVGSPIAILGFPLGTSTAGMDGDINELRPAATMNVGTVSKTLADNLQLDVYAAQGSSGSPVFDARGLVIGVLFGAAKESNGRIVYSVPSSRLVRLLPADAAGVIR